MNADALDPNAVLTALGVTEPVRVRRVGGGADTAIWRVERGAERFALRLFRAEQAAVAEREVAAMAAAAEAGVRVPRVHAAGRWQDRPALLLSWSPGRPLLEELRARPWRAWGLGAEFGRTQAAIHAVPVPAALGGHAVQWAEWAEPDEGLRACLGAVGRRPERLLHLDYHPLNVMVEGGRIVAVLDWANARGGDPRADLARTLSILRLGPLDGVPKGWGRWVRRALTAGWRRGYEEVAGSIGELAPFCAWAGAVMKRDLGPRVGRPDLTWLTPEYLAEVERWTAEWRARAGCPG